MKFKIFLKEKKKKKNVVSLKVQLNFKFLQEIKNSII
jgi:hypothetical protein